jgi:ribosomal protein L44E
MYKSIPDNTERYCFECGEETYQQADGIEFHPGSRSCFRSRSRIEWKFECTVCGTVQL